MCIATSAFAGIACAQSTDGVEIAVSATVAERCGFAPGAASTLEVSTDLENAHSQSLTLRLDCNTPFKVTAKVEGGNCVLAQPGGLDSGDGVAIGREATLTVDWPSQTSLGRRLAAGDYSDTITITIAARS
jgi:spore coat protein U-like protein